MDKNYTINKITIFLFALINLCSCADDDFVSVNDMKDNLLMLKLPEKNIVNINTRTGNDNKGIENIVAVVVRANEAVFEYVSAPKIGSDGSVAVELLTLNPKEDEELHVFCNLGREGFDKFKTKKFTEEQLLDSITWGSGADVMYGKREAGAANTVNLKHSLANIQVNINERYGIDSLIVYNVPKKGTANTKGYVPTSGVEEIELSHDVPHFFVPNSENTTTGNPTCILIKLTGKGWYKLDFYTKDKNLDIDEDNKVNSLNIEQNTFYHFNVLSVKSDGYQSKKEASVNTGSNIIYNLDVDMNISSSSGQYALLADKNEILLYPNMPAGSIVISAVIPQNSTNAITTYTAVIRSKRKNNGKDSHIKIIGARNVLVDSLDLSDGNLVTNANSKKTISFSSVGAYVEGDSLEITLGNLKKRIPFKLLTSNSYLMDCSGTDTIRIPYMQANLMKEDMPGGMTQRITEENVASCEVIWADQPGFSFDLKPDNKKGWIALATNPDGRSFAGNVIIGVKDSSGTVLWSWHIWCMRQDANNPISFDSTKGLYAIGTRFQQSYSSYIWMDRNLGAYDFAAGKASSRGLGYQWGRKDPMTLGGDYLTLSLIPDRGGIYMEGVAGFPDAPMYGSDSRQIFTAVGEVYPGTNVKLWVDNKYNNIGEDALEYAIKYPFCLISLTQESPLYSGWRGYGKDNEKSWLAEDGSKTGYDPCPIGWRIPWIVDPMGPWWALDYNLRGDETYGLRWNIEGNDVYYPYTPMKSINRGTLEIHAGFLLNLDNAGRYYVNRGIDMHFADYQGGVAGMIIINNDGVEGPNYPNVPNGIIYRGGRTTGFARAVRCVKDNSIRD